MDDLCGKKLSLPVTTHFDTVGVTIDFTEEAKIAIRSALNGDEGTHVLIVSADSGGCSGYMYDMQVTEDPLDDEFQSVEVDGMRVLVHNRDSVMLSGITIDYKNELMGGGFQILNPNAGKSCGCGQSFGV
ncbi:MAG: iron-sulfur cluster assembly accessory protein [Candidatus Thalassarchaeaceae archaeon]|jgi:iron-sulfur cluster assembly protein|nr:iron-sulfur cluster assembly accessory protein [Euryarchaeota archaeon]MDP6220452.1 iron-sulfur cluster assembly accessory protein [Candidatus Thalassarchaeaceae archaeon]MBV43928.1 iron-sulfur cluster assembly accessory protein [Euryarchaeota archaeon]MDP7092337.1 iron-sulfur cluster assembly accessory protein [Candidatus Thalassarchaeaceae archaeon]MDP7256726.1 iron-sulfur cluster assembly accessory protein [Candidatus Thalassarchaeaceae archaeon]|tara:strand:- start:4012 stop:4401 length:390 start_codon:yes stop_codon:yes gene_type:complete